MLCVVRAIFTFKFFPPPPTPPQFTPKIILNSRIRSFHSTIGNFVSPSAPGEFKMNDSGDGCIPLQEWQRWGCVSPVPAMVNEVIEDLKLLEKSNGAQMTFGGIGGKIKGDFGIQEDKKHRAKYEALSDSDNKFQFYSARQIACRLLGSKCYLCQKCWLPLEDCMCSKLKPCNLWHGIRFWLYMHPKDFLRQNNTGKLLWQVFGAQGATLCLYGIPEDEEMMWNALKIAGRENVWCLYPTQTMAPKSVEEAFAHKSSVDSDCTQMKVNEDRVLNFILIDGTWSNSAAMFKRLKDQAKLIWGDDHLPCISLTTGISAMHKLRPQPALDRTCTAAAAIGLLDELQLLPEYSSYRLDEQAEALEEAVVVLLDALTARRVRKGRSITRKVRHSRNIC